MAKKYLYKEIPYKPETQILIDVLNSYGEKCWRFHSMAQRLTPGTDFRTGQPKIEIMIIVEKEQFNPFDEQ
jgi:hypothetical protein